MHMVCFDYDANQRHCPHHTLTCMLARLSVVHPHTRWDSSSGFHSGKCKRCDRCGDPLSASGVYDQTGCHSSEFFRLFCKNTMPAQTLRSGRSNHETTCCHDNMHTIRKKYEILPFKNVKLNNWMPRFMRDHLTRYDPHNVGIRFLWWLCKVHAWAHLIRVAFPVKGPNAMSWNGRRKPSTVRASSWVIAGKLWSRWMGRWEFRLSINIRKLVGDVFVLYCHKKFHNVAHTMQADDKGKKIMYLINFNVGGQTGKYCLLTGANGVKSHRSSRLNPQPFAPKALH